MRFPAIPEEERSDAQRAFAAAITAGPRGRLRGPFIPLMHSPDLAGRVQHLGEYLRFNTSLPKDVIEIAVLLTARHYDCDHIWCSHGIQARDAGVEDAVIDALAGRRPVEFATDHQTLAIELCSELLAVNKVSAITFDRAADQWGRQAVLDVAAVMGYYGLLSMIMNVSSVPAEVRQPSKTERIMNSLES